METPGTILKRERESRGVTLKEISSITRIPVSALRHIEEDRYDLFPAEVFAKGFMRNYARELHLNVDDIMLAYGALKGQRVQPSRVEVAEEESRSYKSRALGARVALRPTEAPERSSAPAVAESSQRTFRFAYLIVFLVVATSLGLSILFTGTGEAEENSRRRARPVAESETDEGSSRWLLTTGQQLDTAESSPSLQERSDEGEDL